MHDKGRRIDRGRALSELIVAVLRVNGRLLIEGDRLVEPLGLTSARWQVLGAIALSATPEPVARLARSMGLSRQGVQRIVGDLVNEGLVELRDNPHHRAAKLVLMTRKGRTVYDAAVEQQRPWVNKLSEGLSARQIREAHKTLELLKARLEHWGEAH
jgi:DNA-binding MarR family transcriptional regulator